MTTDQLTAVLAKRVMGWGVGPDRFLTANRGWMPRWRFQPTENLDDAFKLLENAAPQDYSMGDGGKGFRVRVRIGRTVGEAHDISKPRAITFAVARAVGIEVDK
ncbi:MAG: hypothetical protein ABSH46_11190 [Bryobacteraceae bacterium]|jgi:hypothetical protein